MTMPERESYAGTRQPSSLWAPIVLMLFSLAPQAHCATRGLSSGSPQASLTTRILTEKNQEGRILMSNREESAFNSGGGNGGAIAENHACVSFWKVSSAIFDHVGTQPECKVLNGCSGGCCRIFSWLQCDTENEFPHLQCVCSDLTAPQPTPKPTIRATAFPTAAPITPPPTLSPSKSPSPTVSPSNGPTGPPQPPSALPSPSPTLSPSKSPSLSPTLIPTSRPTGTPSAYPSPSPSSTPSTSEPSRLPTKSPSRSPSMSPTHTPSVKPSPMPSNAPSNNPTPIPYTTEDTTDTNGNPVYVTTCSTSPPNVNRVEIGSFQYNYEVYAPIGNQNLQSIVDDYLNDPIHESLAKKFMDCSFTDDDIWVIQSPPQSVDASKSCTVSPPAAQQCFVVAAEHEIWVYNAPGGRRLSRALQDKPVEDFKVLMNTFLFNSMSEGRYNDPANGVNQLFYINDGSNEIITKSPTTSPAPTSLPSSPPSPSPGARSGGVAGANQGNAGDGSAGRTRVSTAVIVVLAVACAAIFFVLLLLALGRRRRRDETREYFKQADNELIHQMATLEEHLDLDSNTGSGGSPRHAAAFSHDEQLMDYSITSSRRSPKTPLRSHDELDRAVGEPQQELGTHRGFRAKPRPYVTSDTVNF